MRINRVTLQAANDGQAYLQCSHCGHVFVQTCDGVQYAINSIELYANIIIHSRTCQAGT